jgi:hypothetical protein
MRPPDDLDPVRDGLALVTACHYDDLEGARAVLDNCRLAAVAAFLARLSSDLIESMTDDPAEALEWLREHHGSAP